MPNSFLKSLPGRWAMFSKKTGDIYIDGWQEDEDSARWQFMQYEPTKAEQKEFEPRKVTIAFIPEPNTTEEILIK